MKAHPSLLIWLWFSRRVKIVTGLWRKLEVEINNTQIVALKAAVKAAKPIQRRGDRETGKSIKAPLMTKFAQDIMYICHIPNDHWGKTSLANFMTKMAGIKTHKN
jgi:hypothetical protein